jgi:DNA adenine methylase
VLNDTADLCRRIEHVNVSMPEWRRQRSVYENASAADLGDLGFAALFLNRTNRSGIISGGVIGGKAQAGEWRLDVRFTKTELVQRIRRIGRYRNRIRLYQMDALNFTVDVLPRLTNAFAFFDPPYIENGKNLYLNDYDVEGHRRLSAEVLKLKLPWVVTYDRAAVKVGLYKAQRRMAYGLSYTAQGRYEGREVMFFSDNLVLPIQWQRRGQILMSHEDSRFPVYGKMENVSRKAPRTTRRAS